MIAMAAAKAAPDKASSELFWLAGGHGGDRKIRDHGDRHLFSGMVGQGVGDLVTHDLRQFVIRGFDLLDEAGIDRHASTGHAEGIYGLRVVDDFNRPFPLRRLRPEAYGLGNQPAGDLIDARLQDRVTVELTFLLQRA